MAIVDAEYARKREGWLSQSAAGPACRDGLHLRILPGRGETLSTLRLASLLGEHESDGDRVTVVTLAIRERHQPWLDEVVRWLRRHGRAVVIRTRVLLDRGVIEVARRGGVTFALELAHTHAGIDSALLGDEAAAGNALLLQAQHLRSSGLPVVARIGPLLPGVHDTASFGRLLSSIAAADLRRVELATGAVDGTRLEIARGRLPAGAQLDLARALSVPPFARFDLERQYRVPEWIEAAMVETFGVMLREAGFDHEQCGCIGACQSPGHYVPVISADLFGASVFGDLAS
jgi:hypothetical protein